MPFREWVSKKRFRIIAAAMTAVLVPLAGMTFVSIFTAREALRKEVLQEARANSRSAAILAGQHLSQKLAVLSIFARRLLLREAVEKGDWPGVQRHLRDLSWAVPDFERAFATDAAGTLFVDHPTIDPAVIGKNFAHREWYKGARQTRQPYLSGVFERSARPVRNVYNFSAPLIADSGEIVGYVVVQDTGEHLQRELGSLGVVEGGGIALVDHNGNTVFEVGEKIHSEEADAGNSHGLAATALKGEESVETSAHSGRGDYVVVFSPVRSVRWAVVIHYPMEQISAPIWSMVYQMLLGGLALLVVAGYITFRWSHAYARNAALLDEAARLNAELDDQRSRYWAILDSSADGLSLADSSRTIMHVNSAMGRIIGLDSAENLIGRPVSVFREMLLSLLAEPETYVSNMAKLWEAPEAVGEFEVEFKDGRVFRVQSAPAMSVYGETIGRTLVFHDVTRDREVDRLKSEFVATVSHELRTPLASLLGFSELMLRRDLPDEKKKQFLEIIHSESSRLNALINDFLDIQRIESGRVVYDMRPHSLGELLREATDVFSGDPRHPLTLDVPEGLPPVRADHDRIRQVLANLLSNAVKFSPDGGEVIVSVRQPDEATVEVSVSDRGLGIPGDALPKLFTKFFRVDSGDRRQIGGTGLGLALCKEIVEAHGGKIRAENRQEGGSTFSFTLALAEAVPPVPPPAGEEAPTAAILIVEDDAAFASLVREHLEEEGFSVRVERTAEEGLTAVRQARPLAVLLDIHLAGRMDGWDFLVAVKEKRETADIPIIITTVTEKRAKGLALGASEYLVKPFEMDLLVDTVRRFVPPGGCAGILVADDDAAFRTNVAETLREAFSCPVEEAADGDEALAKIREQPPDLVILDLVMPRVDGFAVLDAIRSHKAILGLPVLVMTGKTLTPGEKEHLTRGMARVLTKEEYSRERIVALVRELTAKRAERA